MGDTLKPCPFCGSEPYVIKDDSYGGSGVGCTKCPAEPSIQGTIGIPPIKEWNKRHDYTTEGKWKRYEGEELKHGQYWIKQPHDFNAFVRWPDDFPLGTFYYFTTPIEPPPGWEHLGDEDGLDS